MWAVKYFGSGLKNGGSSRVGFIERNDPGGNEA
jgi:hypothetical protein